MKADYLTWIDDKRRKLMENMIWERYINVMKKPMCIFLKD
jgi:hypothetical protein